MTSVAKTAAMLGGIGLIAAGLASAAGAQTIRQPTQTSQAIPKNWNYEIKGGKRVPKAKRQMNPDGSWREEVRQGKCITVKEKSPAGEYKETRRCE